MKKFDTIFANKKFFISFLVLVILIVILLNIDVRSKNQVKLSPYPDGKDFAFTITEDPDGAKLKAVKPIYEFLCRVGMRTTIAVWVKDPDRSNGIPDTTVTKKEGESCQNIEYLEFIKELQAKGFEIALHTVSAGNDTRDQTVKGYEDFKSFFGTYPKINIMHSNNIENIYWGKKVVENRILRFLIGLSSKKAKFPYSGEIPRSKYFWGDICKTKTKYVRMWGTSDINTLKFNPSMPYHNPKKPYVNYWFSFSDGYDVEIFNQLISEKNIKRLQDERGACVVYTHFSAKFSKKNESGIYEIDKSFAAKIQKLSKNEQGWFVPASVLLDRLLAMKNINIFPVQNGIVVANSNNESVEKITIITIPNTYLYDIDGKQYMSNEQGEINLDRINRHEAMTLYFKKGQSLTKNQHYGRFEKLNLILKRMIVYIRHRVIRW